MSAETVNAAFISERKKKIEKKFIKIKQGKWVMMLYAEHCLVLRLFSLYFYSFVVSLSLYRA